MPLPANEVLIPGLATGIGSLPHADARVAAAVACESTPQLPAVPQLPNRSPHETMVAQWVRALPEVLVAPDGSVRVEHGRSSEPPTPVLDATAHGGLLAFCDLLPCRAEPVARVKAQMTGPLTLGIALHRAGLPAVDAFARAGELVRAWIPVLESRIATTLPRTPTVIFLDEPALVAWHESDGPLDREAAVDALSGALATIRGVAGVHVCWPGDRRLALEAGPDVLAVEMTDDLLEDAGALARFLDGDGWVAWGAVPTDRPIGDSADPHWRRLAGVWCELTRRGCDPIRLRSQAVITPACGLAGHGPTQAVRALRLADALADRLHDQTVAARLTLGA
ncbi:MAG TPA: hypothetical protein VFF40_00945 [Acidimicrobiia bacterium]|nr:hypothetical protein [Acidimicrobiia bacterium]